jgi:hypothetical protein
VFFNSLTKPDPHLGRRRSEMKNKKEWETKSLERIHKVREEIDKEIRSKGMTPAQWIKARGKIDIEQLCEKMENKWGSALGI